MTDIDFAAHRAELRRFVLRLVGDPDLAADIVQETLLRAMRPASGFAGRSRPATWLSAIALNVLRDHFRRPARRAELSVDEIVLAELPSADEDVVQALMRGEMADCIARHLLALPERQRQVLALHDMGDASHGEIAAVLGIAECNARVLLHRARAALRQRLCQHCRLDLGRDAIPCQPRDGEAS